MLAKFGTNSGGITWWSKFELIQVLKWIQIQYGWKYNSSYKLYTLGPLCLWQCLFKSSLKRINFQTSKNGRGPELFILYWALILLISHLCKSFPRLFLGTFNSICESWEVKAWLETDVLEPVRSDGGGEFLVACQGQLWQLELLGSFLGNWSVIGDNKGDGATTCPVPVWSSSGHQLLSLLHQAGHIWTLQPALGRNVTKWSQAEREFEQRNRWGEQTIQFWWNCFDFIAGTFSTCEVEVAWVSGPLQCIATFPSTVYFVFVQIQMQISWVGRPTKYPLSRQHSQVLVFL